MSFPVPITYADPPAGTCPTTIDQFVQLLRNITSAEVSTSYLPYVLGSSTPSVEDQNKAWIRIDVAGRPLGTFLFYAGSWRRQYNGKFSEVTMFNGNPSLYFDGTGLGLTSNQWDGWALCNGQNGTPNLTDKFIAGGHMDNSSGQTGYSSGWRTMVSGSIAATGGAKESTLALAQIYRAAKDALLVGKYDAGATRDAAGRLFGLHQDGDPEYQLIAADPGNTSPDPVPTLPPYYALAFVLFRGYA